MAKRPVDRGLDRGADGEVASDVVPDAAGVVLADLRNRDRLAERDDLSAIARLATAAGVEDRLRQDAPTVLRRAHFRDRGTAVGVVEIALVAGGHRRNIPIGTPRGPVRFSRRVSRLRP